MFNKKLKKELAVLKSHVDVLDAENQYLNAAKDALKAELARLKEKPERPDLPWADHDMDAAERTMKAKEIVSNPLMMEIFRGLEEGLANGARSADLSNHIELMSYTMGLQILEQIIDYIEDRISDEKVVEYNQKVSNIGGLKH